jgi:Acyl-CoA synthetases (AMP-forming)/AMP-acid ligases II
VVLEAAAVPIPDDIGGEVVGLFLAARKGTKVDEAQIKQFCQQQLEPYKVPRYIWLMDSLPKTPNGKIDYKKLTDWVKKPDAEAGPEKSDKMNKKCYEAEMVREGKHKGA